MLQLFAVAVVAGCGDGIGDINCCTADITGGNAEGLALGQDFALSFTATFTDDWVDTRCTSSNGQKCDPAAFPTMREVLPNVLLRLSTAAPQTSLTIEANVAIPAPVIYGQQNPDAVGGNHLAAVLTGPDIDPGVPLDQPFNGRDAPCAMDDACALVKSAADQSFSTSPTAGPIASWVVVHAGFVHIYNGTDDTTTTASGVAIPNQFELSGGDLVVEGLPGVTLSNIRVHRLGSGCSSRMLCDELAGFNVVNGVCIKEPPNPLGRGINVLSTIEMCADANARVCSVEELTDAAPSLDTDTEWHAFASDETDEGGVNKASDKWWSLNYNPITKTSTAEKRSIQSTSKFAKALCCAGRRATTHTKKSSKTGRGVIAGAVVGALVFVGAGVAAYFHFRPRGGDEPAAVVQSML